MSEHHGSTIPTWDIAPATLQRLWPFIDVYGRVGRVMASRVSAADAGAVMITQRAGVA